LELTREFSIPLKCIDCPALVVSVICINESDNRILIFYEICLSYSEVFYILFLYFTKSSTLPNLDDTKLKPWIVLSSRFASSFSGIGQYCLVALKNSDALFSFKRREAVFVNTLTSSAVLRYLNCARDDVKANKQINRKSNFFGYRLIIASN
jgi:hypothetical protein